MIQVVRHVKSFSVLIRTTERNLQKVVPKSRKTGLKVSVEFRASKASEQVHYKRTGLE